MIEFGDRAWHKRIGEVAIWKVGACTYGYTLVGTRQSFTCPHEDIEELRVQPRLLFKVGDIVQNTDLDEKVKILNVSEDRYFFSRITLESPGARMVVWVCPHQEMRALPAPTREEVSDAVDRLTAADEEDETEEEAAADVAEQAFGKTLVYEEHARNREERRRHRRRGAAEPGKLQFPRSPPIPLADDAELPRPIPVPREEQRTAILATLEKTRVGMRQEGIFKDVLDERGRQDKKWGTPEVRGAEPNILWVMIAALGEEFGESCQAFLWSLAQKDSQKKPTDKQDPRYELTQVAATAVAMIEMGDAHGWWK